MDEQGYGLDECLRREDAFADRHPDRSQAALALGALVFAWPELESGAQVPVGVTRAYEYLREKAYPLSERYAWHRYFWETAQGSD